MSSHAFPPPTPTLRSLFGGFLTHFPDSIHYISSPHIPISNCVRKTTHSTIHYSVQKLSVRKCPCINPLTRTGSHLSLSISYFQQPSQLYPFFPPSHPLVQLNFKLTMPCTFPLLSSLLWNATFLVSYLFSSLIFISNSYSAFKSSLDHLVVICECLCYLFYCLKPF